MSRQDQKSATEHHPIPTDTPASRATYRAVAAATGRDPLDLPPLGHAIDAESLDALAAAHGDLATTFEYAGVTVTVTGDEVRVEGADGAE